MSHCCQLLSLPDMSCQLPMYLHRDGNSKLCGKQQPPPPPHTHKSPICQGHLFFILGYLCNNQQLVESLMCFICQALFKRHVQLLPMSVIKILAKYVVDSKLSIIIPSF